jgi:hypothetical protein
MYPFGQSTIPFEWIRKIPAEDRDWARRYLSRKGIMALRDVYEPGGASIGQIDNAHHREADLALRNAWRQRKARSKRISTKAYNFVLSIRSKLKLDQIADNRCSTIGDALELLINDEAARVAEHKENQKLTRKTITELRERHKTELHEANAANKNVLHTVEINLQVQTMKLTIANLRLERPMLQHVALSELKDEALKHFHFSWSNVISGMDLYGLGLTERIPNDEMLWRRITAAEVPEDASNIFPEGS